MLAWISQLSWPSILSDRNHRNSFFTQFPSVTSVSSHSSNMSQTPSQDPVDLVHVNGTGHDTTNTERMSSPKPTSTQEDPPTSYQPQTVAHEPLEDSSTQPRSSSLPAPSSKTALSSEAPTDTNAIPNGSNTQNDQAQLPQEDLGSSKDPLEAYDWAELEERFHAEMEKCANREDGIQEEFDELLKVNLLLPTSCSAGHTYKGVFIMIIYTDEHQVFKTWTATGSVHEENRAGKRYVHSLIQTNSSFTTKELLTIQRLRTRMAYVQQREQTLEEKRTHCKPFSSQNFTRKADEDRCQGCESIRECTCAFERTLRGIGVVGMYDILVGLVRLLGVRVDIWLDAWWNAVEDPHRC